MVAKNQKPRRRLRLAIVKIAPSALETKGGKRGARDGPSIGLNHGRQPGEAAEAKDGERTLMLPAPQIKIAIARKAGPFFKALRVLKNGRRPIDYAISGASSTGRGKEKIAVTEGRISVRVAFVRREQTGAVVLAPEHDGRLAYWTAMCRGHLSGDSDHRRRVRMVDGMSEGPTNARGIFTSAKGEQKL